ncbi:O-antigen ligase family protein [Lysobacter soyae]|uniref:O-antigen ligase family protein n=1 Tax=Lysobacter soyae TaxID=2764185 RepID=A0ABX8WQB9_9GAMM|nr:O-antigen ligase family protein [Lysobacter sp. CJ11]QYR52809.1 O-antigen ligase family protein [Lysobacter sp. CJ11]
MTTSNTQTDLQSTGWRWAPWWVLAYVALLPAPGVAEAVLTLGALFTIFRLSLVRFRGGSQLLSAPAWALTTTLFFAYWTPQLIASVDASDHVHALKRTFAGLRYLPFLWLAAIAVADKRLRTTTFTGIGILVIVWSVDALIQALLGESPGYRALNALKVLIEHKPMCTDAEIAAADRIGGVLGPCNLKLGIVLASLSPFALHLAHQRARVPGWFLTAALLGIAILLAGSRASWITFGLVLLLSGWRILGWKGLTATFALGVLALFVLSQTVPQVAQRIERTRSAVTLSEEGVDHALAGRARIWGAAECMIESHPVNGVGPRDFRKAFPACDPEPGVKPAWGQGPALHAHQWVLEVLSETGVIGLLLWLSGIALAWRAWRFAQADAREHACPAMWAVVVTFFPLNTHLAFYSAFWGGIALLLVALYAGSLLAKDELAE